MTNIELKPSVRGFTLIELLIALGIVAILVAFAVPAYKDYTVRSKIAECINEAAIAKLTISEYRQTLGAWPPSQEGAGLTLAGISQYCTGISGYQSASGAFVVDINEAAVGLDVSVPIAPVLTPYMTPGGMINWLCSRGVTDESDLKYLPSSCRSA